MFCSIQIGALSNYGLWLGQPHKLHLSSFLTYRLSRFIEKIGYKGNFCVYWAFHPKTFTLGLKSFNLNNWKFTKDNRTTCKCVLLFKPAVLNICYLYRIKLCKHFRYVTLQLLHFTFPYLPLYIFIIMNVISKNKLKTYICCSEVLFVGSNS